MKHLLFLAALIPGTAMADDWKPLVLKLEALPEADLLHFGLRDQDGRGMDCLEVFQPRGSSWVYGVYHTLHEGVFSVHLARSADLRTWTHLVELDRHASQASMHETPDGAFLMAYERDAPNSCWIGLRYYENLAALTRGEVKHRKDIPRSLAPTAEGTPSFESVTLRNGNPEDSRIQLRFHYYQNARVDQLASGTLTNFSDWQATPAPELNEAFRKLGGLGNLGDRDAFSWNGARYHVQEVQGRVGAWDTWGLYLCDAAGMPLQKLNIETPRKASAFSNPAVTWIQNAAGEKKLVFTAFLHSRGTHRDERGQVLSVIDPE